MHMSQADSSWQEFSFNRDSERPPYFEDLFVGATFDYPSIEITREMRDKHVELYGEDWPDEVVAGPKEQGIVPGPMLMSIVGGKWGTHNLLAIKVLKSIEVKFLRSFCAGDTIVPETTVAELTPHRDPEKDYGYARVEQKLFNQEGELCCKRSILFCVKRRPQDESAELK